MGSCWYRPGIPKRVWVIGAICSALPDLDVIGFRFGIHYGDFLGHRGFTHSLVFSVLLALLVVLVFFRRGTAAGASPAVLTIYLFIVTASHGVLDAMTNGGLGVAFFSPFDTSRYFLPWRPIRVAPISPTRFLTVRGWLTFESEFLWVWIPAIVFAAMVLWMRRRQVRNFGHLNRKT